MKTTLRWLPALAFGLLSYLQTPPLQAADRPREVLRLDFAAAYYVSAATSSNVKNDGGGNGIGCTSGGSRVKTPV